jgi:hypothetical protein
MAMDLGESADIADDNCGVKKCHVVSGERTEKALEFSENDFAFYDASFVNHMCFKFIFKCVKAT